jgi:hypothetical protein
MMRPEGNEMSTTGSVQKEADLEELGGVEGRDVAEGVDGDEDGAQVGVDLARQEALPAKPPQEGGISRVR